MLQRGFSSLLLIFGVVLFIGMIVGGYFFVVNSDKAYKASVETKYINLKNSREKSSGSPNPDVMLSNPASEFCIKTGGELEAKIRGDRSEYNICNFEDKKSCEEWALYKRDCPVGGVKTAGFNTPEQVYCLLIGGKTNASGDDKCTLPKGNSCSNSDLYDGKCE